MFLNCRLKTYWLKKFRLLKPEQSLSLKITMSVGKKFNINYMKNICQKCKNVLEIKKIT